MARVKSFLRLQTSMGETTFVKQGANIGGYRSQDKKVTETYVEFMKAFREIKYNRDKDKFILVEGEIPVLKIMRFFYPINQLVTVKFKNN